MCRRLALGATTALLVAAALAASTAAVAEVLPPGPGAASKPCTIVGSPGADNLTGTAKADVICGRGGDDRILGGPGEDVIRGGPGADRLFGGYGRDYLYGGSGDDLIQVGPGADQVFPGGGTDTCSYLRGRAKPFQRDCRAKPRRRFPGDFCCTVLRRDSTRPILGPVKVSPQVVDSSSGNESIRVSAVALDDDSGVASVVLAIDGPNGPWRELDLGGALEPGSTTLRSAVPIPPSMPSGEYEVTSARVVDKAGNTATYDSEALEAIEGEAAYGALGFSVYHGPDAEAPALAGIQLPASVNTDGAPADVHYSVEATDALSGVERVTVVFGFPERDEGGFGPWTKLETGTAHDGFWSGALSLPRHAIPGAYEITEVTLRDYAGNTRSYTGDDLETLGFAHEFVDLGEGDSTAPEILHFQVDTPTTSSSNGSSSYTVHWRVRDDLSGIGDYGDSYFGGLGFNVQGPNGGGVGGSGTNAALESGTDLEGNWVATWQLQPGAPPGQYRVSSIEATDRAGNRTVVGGPELEASGWDLTWDDLP